MARSTALAVAVLWLLGAGIAQAAIAILSVSPGGPADAAGIVANDRLVRLDGRTVDTPDDLHAVISAHKPGDTVPVVVGRDGTETELRMTFGERKNGSVSLGVRISYEPAPDAPDTRGTKECRRWIENTYHVRALLKEFDLGFEKALDDLLVCVRHDTQRMASDNAIQFCDNVFKVHCSGVDLLAEIGESQVARCEASLKESLGVDLGNHPKWMSCGRDAIYEPYAREGKISAEADCRAALLDTCGSNIDDAVRHGSLSGTRKAFVDCCSADALNAADGACGMIDPGFERGPCSDRAVCVDRTNGDWLTCSVLSR